MKTLLSNLLQSLLGHRNNITSGAKMDNVTPTFDFGQLGPIEQEHVRQYFAALVDVVQLTKSIRGRHVAVDVPSVLTAFEQAERAYIWSGLRPIFPPAIYRVTEFDVSKLAGEGLLSRLGDGEKPVIYSGAMRQLVAKLTTQYNPRMLDSQAFKPMS